MKPAYVTGKRHNVLTPILKERKGHLLDLGSGHGNWAERAHEKGWKVTAVDARTERWSGKEGITWIQSDVRDFQILPNEYDLIFLLGLLYHLTFEDQIKLLSKCNHTETIIETHVGKPQESIGKYKGHFHQEFPEDMPDEERTEHLLSAWKNTYSFWLTEESLVAMLKDCGFKFAEKLQEQQMPDGELRMTYRAVP
ncbi:MAG: class I SAM-dependent methyltransferase [Candidatus Peribacteraceae bacterium]|jgi:hypothetical protein|nr:class I SAM-dependent methyltransferase [Candidatus Peribacteraceae bacterium]HCI03497.1 hypothetical protein [Candidatus Peribacteria bacterium]|tara:strand:+ start:1258 stop:1845 length:588 start_codon:yes stop_codon:yes gene_type:complete